MVKSKIREYNDNEFANIIATSHSYSECLRKMGMGTRGGCSLTVLKERISEQGCSVSHFKRQYEAAQDAVRQPLESILTERSTYKNMGRLKMRLVSSGLKSYRCEQCGLSWWRGEPISLQIHHINGDRTDNRIDNLELLCPNCHSQTSNYAGKKK